MGSCVSCNLKSSAPTKVSVFDTKGKLQQLELPIIAAELMLDETGTVVCSLDEIRKTNCLWAMRADEQLEGGKIYLIVPAQRVYCKVSESEMAVIKRASNKKGALRDPKVFPSVEEEEENDTAFFDRKLGNIKQWRPMLEPIHEGGF